MLWVRDGHLGVNRDMIYRMVSHQRKEVHPFPYVDCCLPIADWNDLMWSTNGIDPSIGPKTTTTKFEKELKDLHAADVMRKPTAKELTWVKQHACLYYKHKHLDRFGMLRIQCRIKAITKSSRNRLDSQPSSMKRTLMKNQTRMGSFQDRRARCTHHVQQGEFIAEANYPKCDAHSLAQIPGAFYGTGH